MQASGYSREPFISVQPMLKANQDAVTRSWPGFLNNTFSIVKPVRGNYYVIMSVNVESVKHWY